MGTTAANIRNAITCLTPRLVVCMRLEMADYHRGRAVFCAGGVARVSAQVA